MDCIQFLGGQQFPKITVLVAVVVVVVGVDLLFVLRGMVLIDIANRDELHVGDLQKLSRIVPTFPSGPDRSHDDPIAGRRYASQPQT